MEGTGHGTVSQGPLPRFPGRLPDRDRGPGRQHRRRGARPDRRAGRADRVIRRLLPLAAAALLASACTSPALAESAVATPAAKVTANEGKGLKTAIFAGGCFWGIEGIFSHLKGVTSAVAGYHGGSAATATYDRTSDGDTGHAESVRVTYDPAVIRYDQLLRVFFAVGADPTQLNRQGPDRGTQYRTALVPVSAEQNRVAAAYLAQLKASGLWKKPLVARIEPAQAF